MQCGNNYKNCRMVFKIYLDAIITKVQLIKDSSVTIHKLC